MYYCNYFTLSIFKKNITFFNKNFNFIDLNYELTKIQKNYPKFTIKGDDHPNKLGSNILYEIIYKKLLPLVN